VSIICNLFLVSSETADRLLKDPATIYQTLDSLDESDADLPLDKSWHGLQFLLTGQPVSGDPPLNFLTEGGTDVGDVDVGYGPPGCSIPWKSLHCTPRWRRSPKVI